MPFKLEPQELRNEGNIVLIQAISHLNNHINAQCYSRNKHAYSLLQNTVLVSVANLPVHDNLVWGHNSVVYIIYIVYLSDIVLPAVCYTN